MAIEAGIGRFGPFVKHGKTYANICDPEEVFTIGMNRAVELIAQKAQRGGRGAAVKPLRELGSHPEGGTVAVYAGRYGPYVKWEKVNATLPKELAPETVSLEEALSVDRGEARRQGQEAALRTQAGEGRGQGRQGKGGEGSRARRDELTFFDLRMVCSHVSGGGHPSGTARKIRAGRRLNPACHFFTGC